MIKKLVFCFVMLQVASLIQAEYNEELENSFLPYGQNEGPVSPFQGKIQSILGSTQKQLTKLEQKMLDNIKSITFVEFQNDNEGTKDSKMVQLIDWTSTTTSQDKQEEHRISKRGINPRFRQAAVSAWAALGSEFAGTGKTGRMSHSRRG